MPELAQAGGLDFERVAAGALLIGLFAIRVPFHRKALRERGHAREFESRTNILLRLCAALGMFGLLGAWFAGAGWLTRFAMPDAPWLRWGGLPIGLAGLILLYAVHRALDANFSGTLHLRADHELVVLGPYHYVRHPMYSAFYLIVGGFALLSANWLIAIPCFAGLTAVMLSRVAREEAVMTERFGDAYRAYSRRTGRFIPALRSAG